jgi:CubicO group peptidase (beta-lactamase class C family)
MTKTVLDPSAADRIQAICDEAVQSGYVAGVNVLAAVNGNEICYLQSGFSDLENKVPIGRDTIFRLYSMSKPVTSAAVMLLMERGCIDLADPVETYLPGFRGQKVWEDGHLVPARRSVTIHDLLSMTSGLTYGGIGSDTEKEMTTLLDSCRRKLGTPEEVSTLDLANQVGALPLAFQPGEHFRYGFSADIAGAVVEAVSGMRFGDFLKKEIFDPLGMNDTGFSIAPEKVSRLSSTYLQTAPGKLVSDPTTHLDVPAVPIRRPAFESGGAGLLSTLPDFLKFGTMLLNGGALNGTRILREETVRFMTRAELLPGPQQDLERDWTGLTGYSYGNFLRVMKNPGQAVLFSTKGEYGWDGWLGPFFSNHPEEKITFLMGMSRENTGTGPLTRKVRNVLLDALL